LEKKFHEHFFSGYNELKLSHLTSVKRCFNVFIVEKNLVHLASNGLHSYFKEKLGSFDFFSVNQVMQLALATKSQNKEARKHHKQHCPNVHLVEYHSDTSYDDCGECYLTEFAWPPTSRNVTMPSLKPIQKN
jgi:hypothetical protein